MYKVNRCDVEEFFNLVNAVMESKGSDADYENLLSHCDRLQRWLCDCYVQHPDEKESDKYYECYQIFSRLYSDIEDIDGFSNLKDWYDSVTNLTTWSKLSVI